ncbi:TIGR02677 family protein [Rhodococcus rhodnii]|uniref:TIGR02677 family protein n=1 Tax=Rhodococcus rhodnii TaxID=38312 RepID=A0A6P2CK40_9NOCA|nr:TIGR02677 family protein [Rhodococcus rhodnii]TXG92723.1 TIGR02677 family protein [Rhodococcus rhodnii]
MRVLSFATADRRTDYLRVLRAFDHAHRDYAVVLHARDVEAHVAHDTAAGASALTTAEIAPLLEQLHTWGVLDRSFDGRRATSLTEYRNRHFVYQFTPVGHQAFAAVDELLRSRDDDIALARLALPELLTDLTELAAATRDGDGELVYRKLNRLAATFAELTDRAARFYLAIGTIARTTDASIDTFLAHKDALLTHMREFGLDLARYAPTLRAAIDDVTAAGVESMVAAARHDGRVLLSLDERADHWRGRWLALSRWFVPDGSGPSEAQRLRDATTSAIAGVLSLLRRVTEGRRTGISRHTQLRTLAEAFAASPDDHTAHSLFRTVFDLSAPRHVGVAHEDADVAGAHDSWWDAPPVPLSRTLAETGRTAAPAGPAKLERDDDRVRRLRERQLETGRARRAAAASLAGGGVLGRTLSTAETDVLLRLLDTALSTRVTVSGRVADVSGGGDGVRIDVHFDDAAVTVIDTDRGRLHLAGFEVAVR